MMVNKNIKILSISEVEDIYTISLEKYDNYVKDLNLFFDFEDYLDYILKNILLDEHLDELGIYLDGQYYKIEYSQDLLKVLEDFENSVPEYIE